MAKTLILHRHSEKTTDGKHISRLGRDLAIANARVYYRGQNVDHVFWSPLIRATETAICMMTASSAFDNAVMHSPVVGLGTSETMTLIATEKFKDLVAGGVDSLEALFASEVSILIIKALAEETEEGLRAMFNQMSDGELGVGVFHDPLISLAAIRFGLQNAKSLSPMEAIAFTMNDDNTITADYWPQIN